MFRDNVVKPYSAILALTNVFALGSLLLVGALCCLSANAEDGGKASPADAQVAIDPGKLIRECFEKYKAVKDYTCIFIKRERIGGKRKRLKGNKMDRVGGKLQKPETIFMKFRERPFSVYLKWIRDPNKGREVIYSRGNYRNRLVIHLGGLFDFTLEKRPNDKDVLKAARGPITEAGIGNIIKRLVRDLETNEAKAKRDMVYLGTETIEGRRETYRIMTIGPNNEYNVFYFVILYIDKELLLPIKVACYDWDYTLQATYAYTNLKLNVGLTDKDFDKNSKEYKFHGFPLKLLP